MTTPGMRRRARVNTMGLSPGRSKHPFIRDRSTMRLVMRDAQISPQKPFTTVMSGQSLRELLVKSPPQGCYENLFL